MFASLTVGSVCGGRLGCAPSSEYQYEQARFWRLSLTSRASVHRNLWKWRARFQGLLPSLARPRLHLVRQSRLRASVHARSRAVAALVTVSAFAPASVWVLVFGPASAGASGACACLYTPACVRALHLHVQPRLRSRPAPESAAACARGLHLRAQQRFCSRAHRLGPRVLDSASVSIVAKGSAAYGSGFTCARVCGCTSARKRLLVSLRIHASVSTSSYALPRQLVPARVNACASSYVPLPSSAEANYGMCIFICVCVRVYVCVCILDLPMNANASRVRTSVCGSWGVLLVARLCVRLRVSLRLRLHLRLLRHARANAPALRLHLHLQRCDNAGTSLPALACELDSAATFAFASAPPPVFAGTRVAAKALVRKLGRMSAYVIVFAWPWCWRVHLWLRMVLRSYLAPVGIATPGTACTLVRVAVFISQRVLASVFATAHGSLSVGVYVPLYQYLALCLLLH
ncbi:hypothetical protein Emed_006367 [Eimeria media]